MLPFSFCNIRFNLLKRVYTFYIELLKVIKRYEMRNENGNCHSKMKEIQSNHVGIAIYSTKTIV